MIPPHGRAQALPCGYNGEGHYFKMTATNEEYRRVMVEGSKTPVAIQLEKHGPRIWTEYTSPCVLACGFRPVCATFPVSWPRLS